MLELWGVRGGGFVELGLFRGFYVGYNFYGVEFLVISVFFVFGRVVGVGYFSVFVDYVFSLVVFLFREYWFESY